MDDTFKHTELKYAGGLPALLPCPFCGEMPVITQTKNGVLVSCVEPKCPMDIVATYIDLSPSDVIAAWNTRAFRRWMWLAKRHYKLKRGGYVEAHYFSDDIAREFGRVKVRVE